MKIQSLENKLKSTEDNNKILSVSDEFKNNNKREYNNHGEKNAIDL